MQNEGEAENEDDKQSQNLSEKSEKKNKCLNNKHHLFDNDSYE